MRDIDYICSLIKDHGYGAELITPEKDGEVRTAIKVSFKNSNISPVVYIDCYPEYTYTDEDIAEFVVELAEKSRPNDFNINHIISWDEVKNKVYPCVCHKSNVNSNALSVNMIADITLYFRIKVDSLSEDGSLASIVLSKELFDKWGVTFDRVYKTAFNNLENNFSPATFCGMPVLTNEDRLHGAALMFSEYALETFLGELDLEECYIIPSSIHEVLIVDCNLSTPEEIKKMIADVNEGFVEPNEVLSEEVYHYTCGGNLRKV